MMESLAQIEDYLHVELSRIFPNQKKKRPLGVLAAQESLGDLVSAGSLRERYRYVCHLIYFGTCMVLHIILQLPWLEVLDFY